MIHLPKHAEYLMNFSNMKMTVFLKNLDCYLVNHDESQMIC